MIESLPNLRIVLVGTQHPGNIGSAARAMKTMGLSALHLVAPERFPDPEANTLAAGADDLLAAAPVHADLDAALAGCHFVLGTSARRRHVPLPELGPREAAERLLDAAGQGPVALLFGRERTGLENAELQRCHFTVGIPTDPGFSSLNLAAAVQVLSYELRLAVLARAGNALASASAAATRFQLSSTVRSIGVPSPSRKRYSTFAGRRGFMRSCQPRWSSTATTSATSFGCSIAASSIMP